MTTPIPKRIIQTGNSSDLPLLAQAAVTNIRLLNPEFEYVFFDDPARWAFVAAHFPEYVGIVQSFEHPAQRYDFFRYLALYQMGGFYFDLDIFLVQNLSPLLGHGCVFPFERLTWSDYLRDEFNMDWEIGNYAFGASARHPFIKACIDNCVRAHDDPRWAAIPTSSLPRSLRKDLAVIYSTGPGLVSRTLAEYKNSANPVEVLFPHDVSDKKNCWNLFGKFGVHLAQGTWRKQRNPVSKRLLNFVAHRNETRAIRLARMLGPTRSSAPTQSELTSQTAT